MKRRDYKCSNPACGVVVDEKKALSRGNGCKCGGKTPRVLRCPVCGGVLNRVGRPESQPTDGHRIGSHKL